MGLRKNVCCILFILLTILVPNYVSALGTTTKCDGGGTCADMNNTNYAEWTYGGATTNAQSQIYGSYYLRYDVTELNVSDDYKVNIIGWGIIKDHDNGYYDNETPDWSYAPTYYIRAYESGNESNSVTYEYKPPTDRKYIEFNELNNNGASRDYGPGHENYEARYDNSFFMFSDIDLSSIVSNSPNQELYVVFEMKIVTGSDSDKVSTVFFPLGMYNSTSSNGGKTITVDNPNINVKTTNRVAFIASTAFSANVEINGHSETLRRDDGGQWTLNGWYDIDKVEPYFIISGHDIKYAYSLSPASELPAPDDLRGEGTGRAPSTWIQFGGDSTLALIVDKTFVDCTKPASQLSAQDLQYCCNNDVNFVNTESNKDACCGNSGTSTNVLIEDSSINAGICCYGTYAYKHVQTPGHESACCNQVPELCCTNESFVNANWASSTTLRGVCCGLNPFELIHNGIGYTFNTFKSANRPNLTQQYNSKCVITENKKICDVSYGSNKEVSNEVNEYLNSISYNQTYGASGSGTVEIILDDDVSHSGTISSDNITYFINGDSGFDLSLFNLEISNVSYDQTNNKITINYNYDIAPSSAILNGNYNFTIKFWACINNSTPSPGGGGGGGTPYNEHLKENLDSNLDCNKGDFSTYKEVYEGREDNVNITCIQEINVDKMSSTEDIGNVYSGTGFSYDITLTNKITCKASYSSVTIFNSESSANNFINKFKTSNSYNPIKNKAEELAGEWDSNHIKFIDDYSAKEIEYTTTEESSDETSETTNLPVRYSVFIPNIWSPGGTHQTRSKDSNVYKSYTVVTKYNATLPNQYIHRLTGEISDIDDGSNFINGGSKFYTEINTPTGFANFKINFGEYVDDSNIENLTCAYASQDILTTGGNISISDGKASQTSSNKNYLTRPISLSNPFNTEPGDIRATNWAADDDYKDDYITNTMNDIMEKPMYEFTLTPGDINKIQKYNKNNNGNYNSWNYDTSKFEINTSDDAVTNRTSNFVTCLLNNSGPNCNNYVKINDDGMFNNDNAQGIGDRSEKTGDFE